MSDDHVHLRIHRHKGDTRHIISVFTGATVRRAGSTLRKGVIVDVDSIRKCQVHDYPTFARTLSSGLDELRQENKEIFFDCLHDTTIQEMEPTYD